MTINTELLFFILDHTPESQNIMLCGKHGIGKSQILEKYYSQKGQKVVTLFLGQMSDPGDLIGLPEKNEKTGKTDFMLPYWFPLDDEPIVLFLDELNRARPEVLQTIMDLTLNRKLAGKSLPKGSRIISAVNNGNEYQLTDLDPALVSRFNIYNFAPEVSDWLKWAKENNIDERIIDFISENPEFLDSEGFEDDSDSLERFPDRRSWHRTSEIIKTSENLDENYKVLISGILGNKASANFFRFINEKKIPSAKKILFEDFENNLENLKNLSVLDFTVLNNSIFQFIEAFDFSYDDKIRVSKNIVKYFDFLQNSNQSEVLSHFASLCSFSSFPKTLSFINENSNELYKKLLSFIDNF